MKEDKCFGIRQAFRECGKTNLEDELEWDWEVSKAENETKAPARSFRVLRTN
jgi:hypothetical protein